MRRGFSLLELLVVLVVLSILAAIAVPLYLAQRDKAKDCATEMNVRNLAIACGSWYDIDHYCPAASDMTPAGVGQFLSRWPTNPFSGRPVALSAAIAPGDFAYESDGDTYTITGWLHDGSPWTFGSGGGL